jgi:hypothetical protein
MECNITGHSVKVSALMVVHIMKRSEIFFVVNHSFILDDGTVNAQFYLKVMAQLLQRILLVSPDFHENKNCVLLHDSSPA